MSKILHPVVHVYQLYCAVPESDGLSHSDGEIRLLTSNKLSPQDYSQKGCGLRSLGVEILVKNRVSLKRGSASDLSNRIGGTRSGNSLARLYTSSYSLQ
jgi:hypothetical protein